MAQPSNIILYQSEDGKVKLETVLENDTVWLTQKQLSELFQTTPQNITLHLKNIYVEGELEEIATCKEFLQVQMEGIRTVSRKQKQYNLDAILSVGYRIKSHIATRFRQWATARLKEYIIKGFTMNDDLLKNAGGGSYFDELLSRIRDIRSSEKIFWRKILDIYATSIDYDPKTDASVIFFKTIQNKMHWAAHGSTAAEVIYKRIGAQKPHLRLTNFKGASGRPTKEETTIAKNYLTEKELNVLNRIVTAYLEIAELQALNRKPMYMKDWISRLDDFLQMTGNEILDHAGSVSHQQMLKKAEQEYEVFKRQNNNELSEIDLDFIRQIEAEAKRIKGKNDQ